MIDTVAKMSMAILLIAAVPLDAPSSATWAEWGLAGVIVAFVLVRDAQREKRMGAAIDTQQKWIRETLVKTLERNAAAMERMAAWLEGERDSRRTITRRLHAVEGHHDDHG
jgi:hypothetical protein